MAATAIPQLVSQLHTTIDDINHCLDSFNDTTNEHDASISALEEELQNKLQSLQQKYDENLAELKAQREQEAEEWQNKLHEEDEEIRLIREREDKERAEKRQHEEQERARRKEEVDRQKDEERLKEEEGVKGRLEEEMDRKEDEIERKVEEGRKKLKDLDSQRKVRLQFDESYGKELTILCHRLSTHRSMLSLVRMISFRRSSLDPESRRIEMGREQVILLVSRPTISRTSRLHKPTN